MTNDQERDEPELWGEGGEVGVAVAVGDALTASAATVATQRTLTAVLGAASTTRPVG
ncbi:MAG: hypothetical protein ACOH17_14265 [Cellulomonas sp.]